MKSLHNIKTYEGGASNIPGKRNVIKLSSNESPFGPSPNVVSKIKKTIRKFNRFAKNMAIAMYNYLNAYPTEETLPFRQLMFERLKHPYMNKQEEKSLQS